MLYKFLKRIFNKKTSNKLSKGQYWEKFELIKLFEDLFKAEILLKELIQENTNDIALQKFTELFTNELYYIEADNVPDFTNIMNLFKPGGEWNSFPFLKENQLGMDIYRRSNRWKRNQSFAAGDKVSLEGEFGVVLYTSDELCGLICWDTNIENDTEDWRGMFGSFQAIGGEIIDPDYKFKFINDDGSKK
jgi:hypothetical protein